MADDIIDLRSVNWSQGMFLTPDHFLRQERYLDSALLWTVRYATATAGLIGGGPRVNPTERGAASFDPIIEIDDTADTLKISVTQCRGMTPGGAVVDVGPSYGLTASFAKPQLDGVREFGVFVVARPHDKEPEDAIEDPINPQLQIGRRLRYQISLSPSPDEKLWSLLVLRMRRATRGLGFERVAGFVPPCAFMSSHSELMHAFRQLNERVAAIADHYSALHRAVVDFVAVARTFGLPVEQDLEALAFVNRMVVTLEDCAYRIVDPLQSPKQFFQETNQLIRSAALFLSLSPPTKQYFRLLGEIGETEFVTMLEQEGEALEMGRHWSLDEDLGLEAKKVDRALQRLDRLEQALEGKYMDYRISQSLESINFVFDLSAGDPVLYKAVAKPARPQAQGQELTFVFAQLNLGARDQYRLILIGEQTTTLVWGDSLTAELLINAGEGYRRQAEYKKSKYEVADQRNFAVDFSAPADVNTLTDVRVSLRSSQLIRSAMLYVRARIVPTDHIRSRPPHPPPPSLPDPPSPAVSPSPDQGGRRRRIVTERE